MEALRGVDILGEGTFRFNFDKKMNEDSRNITAVGQESGWATLRWSEGAVNKTYIMYDTYIEISGSAETRKGRHICPINSDAVSAGHVHIRYDQQSQTFQLAAWAKIRLNQREVPLSDDNTIRWVSLPRFKSNLFLNDAVHIDFNANPDML